MIRVTTALRRDLVAGSVAGLVGAAGFAAAHAALIVPIWTRAGSGLLSGTLAGTVAGWAYAELGFDPARAGIQRRLAAHLGAGAAFGALLWLAVVPVTLADALLRALGVLPRYESAGVVLAVFLAIGAGALLGWRRTHTWRAVVAGASATLMLTIAMVGPVPVGRSLRAFAIFLAVLPVAAVAGAVLGTLSWSLQRSGASAAPQAETSHA
jgi:hypothetical protein